MENKNFYRLSAALSVSLTGLLAGVDHCDNPQISSVPIKNSVEHEEYVGNIDYGIVEAPKASQVSNLQPTEITIPSINIKSAKIEESKLDGKGSLTVPDYGFATPPDGTPGLPKHTAWVYAHSSWEHDKDKGTFKDLDKVEVGDEVFIGGKTRTTGKDVSELRYIVKNIYLADRGSGTKLVMQAEENESDVKHRLLLQSTIREYHVPDPDVWVLDKDKILEKATNIVEGDLRDLNKYLLLFVEAYLVE